MIYLKQGTTGQIIELGPFLDSADGDTEETALTIANTDILLHKYGAVATVSKNSGGATHMANGRYYITLDATDTDTLGAMRVGVHVAGALYVWVDCLVMTAEAYETFINTGVFNQLLASHNVVDTFGERFNSLGTADDIWAVPTRELTAGTKDAEIDAIKGVTDKVDTALEADGAAGYQYTTLALENGPSGTGGDATLSNQTTILANQAIIDGKIDIVQTDMTFVRGMTGGNWEVVGNQMIFYNEASTEIKRFDLTKDGIPDSDAPDKRTIV